MLGVLSTDNPNILNGYAGQETLDPNDQLLDVFAIEVRVPFPQYLPHGVSLEDYQSGLYTEYRRGFLYSGNKLSN